MMQIEIAGESFKNSTDFSDLNANLFRASYLHLSEQEKVVDRPASVDAQYIDLSAPVALESGVRAANFESVDNGDCDSIKVTRGEKGELKRVEFTMGDSKSWIERSKDGKSWVSEPPVRKDRSIENVSVRKDGSVVVEVRSGKDLYHMTLNCKGQVSEKKLT